MERFLRWLGTPKQWLDPKGIRLWLMVVLAIYALAGFFLAPWIVKRTLPSMVEQTLARHASIGRVSINPFVLSVDLRDFRLDDTDGSLLLGFNRLYVNFQTTSLFHWAWTFAEIRLEGVRGRLVRGKHGVTNIARLIHGMKRTPARHTSSSPVRLIVDRLVVDNSSIEVIDRSRPNTFRRVIGPINVVVRNLSTLPDNKGSQQVAVDAGNGIRLGWKGGLQLRPLRLTGHVTVHGPLLRLAYDYLKDQLAFAPPTGDVDIRFDYRIGEPAGQPLSVNVSGLDVVLKQVQLRAVQGSDILRMPRMELDGGSISWPADAVRADRLLVSGLSASIVRAGDGQLNIMHLLRGAGSSASRQSSSPGNRSTPDPLADWHLALATFELRNLHLGFEDDTLATPGSFDISNLSATVHSITNKPGARFPMDLGVKLAAGGQIHVTGDVSALPSIGAQLNVSGEGIACSAAQPWVSNVMRVHIQNGTIGFKARVDDKPDSGVGLTGNLTLADLAVNDALNGDALLGWHSVTLERFSYQQARNHAEISTVDVNGPYVSVTVNRDRTTNLQRLMVTSKSRARSKGRSPDKATAFTIGRVRIEKGSADFSDDSLPLPFHASIERLHGVVTTLSTATSEPARVRLQGRVGHWGMAQIRGDINPLGPALYTDVGVLFRNIDFPDLSPYTIKFAGRRIASGRLDLNLHYKLDKDRLDGKNNIVIRDFKLGEKVKQPGAMDLPLGLAVALLEDKDGKIDLDVPVTGNVDQPDFKISGVIMKAISHVITGMVTSPFRLLGKLVGGKASEDFGRIDFEPGRALLSPPEKEKLAKLAKALALRPSLSLKVPGTVAPQVDETALRRLRVDGEIAALIKAANASKPEMYTEARQRAVESLFTKQFPKVSLVRLRQKYTTVPADQPGAKPKFDEPAYVAALRQSVIDAQVITEGELAALAGARANVIVGALKADAGVSAARMEKTAQQSAKPVKTGWVPVSLDVYASNAKDDGGKAGLSSKNSSP